MIQALIGIVLSNVISTLTINSELTAILLIVSIDSIISILKDKLESTFNDKIVFINFIINLAASLLFLYFGNYIDLNLYYLALLALVLNIFKNLSMISKYLIKKYKKV